MDVVVVYESKTGTTRRAALAMGDEFFDRGVRCRTYPVKGVDPAAIGEADLIVIGSWVDGLFAVGQRPGGRRNLERALGVMSGPEGTTLQGKRVALYCTYAVAPGRTLSKMEALVAELGGEVVGGLAIRRDSIGDGAARLVAAVADLSTV